MFIKRKGGLFKNKKQQTCGCGCNLGIRFYSLITNMFETPAALHFWVIKLDFSGFLVMAQSLGSRMFWGCDLGQTVHTVLAAF